LNRFKRNLAISIISLIIGVVLAHALIGLKIVPKSDTIYLNVVITVLFSIIIIELISKGILAIGTKMLDNEGSAISDLFRVAAYSIVAITVLYELKINVTGLLLGAGFLGIVLGIAAQNTLGNILAGFEIMATKPFKIGDTVKISTWQYGYIASTWPHSGIVPGFEGKVEKIGLVYSTIVDLDNIKVYVPNGVLIQAAVINYARSDKIHLDIRVELPLSKNFNDFKSKLEKAVKSLPRSMQSKIFGLYVEITDINNAFYGVSVKAEVPIKDYVEIRNRVREKSLEALNETKQVK